MTRAKLLKLRAVYGAAIRASEPWEESYKKDAKTFRQLVDQEQLLQRDLSEYFYELATMRLSRFVNWSEVMPKLKADVVPPKSDDAYQEEQVILVNVVLPHVEELVAIGALAGERIYGTTPEDLTAYIMDSARTRTAGLVSGVTDTTRDLIRKSIRSSIDRGDTVTEMVERLRQVVNNPVRAEMIAQTESVNSYQDGLQRFAVETGAVKKEWEAKAGACPVCRPLDGMVVGIDDTFDTLKGPVERPAVHPRCRCALIYHYED